MVLAACASGDLNWPDAIVMVACLAAGVVILLAFFR